MSLKFELNLNIIHLSAVAWLQLIDLINSFDVKVHGMFVKGKLQNLTQAQNFLKLFIFIEYTLKNARNVHVNNRGIAKAGQEIFQSIITARQ